MKTITVSGAVILRENNGIKEILATQRGYGDSKGGWEIPGGKLEPGETPEQCTAFCVQLSLENLNFWNTKQPDGSQKKH